MSIVIDANMKLFSERLNITSSRMINDYGNSSIDEIIEAEAEKGNTQAVKYAQAYYNSPQKLIDLFELTNVENRFVIINNMKEKERLQLLTELDTYDLVMGLYFFNQETLLKMMMNANIKEVAHVAVEALSIEGIMANLTENDLSLFYMQEDLPRGAVLEQILNLPSDIMKQFIEGVTGMPETETSAGELVSNLANMPEDDYRKFMASIDPEVQRQLTYQLTLDDPSYLLLFPNETYVNMLANVQKPDMVKSMAVMNQNTLAKMNANLPQELMSIVCAQIDAGDFAKFLQHFHMGTLNQSLMI